MIKKRRCGLWSAIIILWLMLWLVLWLMPLRVRAELRDETAGGFDTTEIEKYLKELGKSRERELSFQGVMTKLREGDFSAVLTEAAKELKGTLFYEIKNNAGLMGRIMALAFAGAAFSAFSEIFGSGQVSETGYYVIYLIVMTVLASGFFASMSIAEHATEEILGFMKVLLPAYFLAVTMAGGALTSAAVCGFTLGAIGLVQTIVSKFLLPAIRIYMMTALAGSLYREDLLSRFTELLQKGILWTMKGTFGIIVGFHLIQGMVMPQADAVKNASIIQALQVIPGVGNGAGEAARLVMGSGVLIKNAAGAAAVIFLFIIAAVPLIKLFALMVLYYLAAAIMQPVCDSRLVACIAEAAKAHGILLKLTAYSMALFAVTIAILCVSTNAAWYAG